VNLFSSLVVTHVALATTGYAGLIAGDLWLVLLAARRQAELQIASIDAWRKSAQIFGPMLGIGALIGFGLAAATHEPLLSSWLVATYFLAVIALGTQVAIMVPWQRRSNRTLAEGGLVSTRPVVAVLLVLSVAFVGVLAMMVMRPT
jgi:hypothetical protein